MAFISRTSKGQSHQGETARLVAQAQADPSTFGALYNHYIQPVYRYIYNRVGHKQEAEDLTAQTFLSALQALPGYRDRDLFSAWLFAIARNKVMDYYRQNKRESGLDVADQRAGNPGIEEQVDRNLDVQRLTFLVRGLKESDQELIRLRYVADLTFAEMAGLLGKREQAVKKSLYRLLARLKSQMETNDE